ncbi:MAG: hypothetical protein CMK96_06285 [Pseudomonas sp.]|nr:hypothetical protein [Pseudomonas sp.]|tara:strand:- start:263 stop:595 length:333 start_codon:yes stop_codon:yes gene_type:complete
MTYSATWHRDIRTAPGPLTDAQRANLHRVADEYRAEMRAKRAAIAALICPRKPAPRRPLADALVAHLKAGGCGGDACPHCKGQGAWMDQYDHDRWTEAECDWCNGTGLGR